MKKLPVLTSLKIFTASSVLLAAVATAAHIPEELPTNKSADAVCLQTVNGVSKLNKNNCRVYINGFIDGAELTDSVIINKVRDRSPFFERAYSTRVGTGKESLPVTYFADFCIDKNIARQEVIDRVIDQLEMDNTAATDERSAVYSVIKRLYACGVK